MKWINWQKYFQKDYKILKLTSSLHPISNKKFNFVNHQPFHYTCLSQIQYIHSINSNTYKVSIEFPFAINLSFDGGWINLSIYGGATESAHTNFICKNNRKSIMIMHCVDFFLSDSFKDMGNFWEFKLVLIAGDRIRPL